MLKPKKTTLPRSGSRVRAPSPAPVKAPENAAHSGISDAHVPASISLNEPRTVPNCAPALGNPRAEGSHKVLAAEMHPPNPKKRSPRNGGNRARAKSQIGVLKSSDNTPPTRRPQRPKLPFEQVEHAVYIGRTRRGGYRRTAKKRFEVFGPTGGALGIFKSRSQAISAIDAANETVTIPAGGGQ